ncbi:MAG TPA: hypothetical protein VHC22_07270 [Pirellulales bacterium]|nr:hypothetical protein [Pirellulales bacterium]
MRYLLIVVLACSPLAALTAWSLWEGVSGYATPVNNENPVISPTVEKRASAAIAAASEEQRLVQELAQTDPLGTRDPELPDTADAPLKEAWTGSQQARKLLSKFARVGKTNIPSDVAPNVQRHEAEAALARLKGFIDTEKPNSMGQLSGADDFFALLERRASDLQKEIGRFQQKDRIAEAAAAVQSDLDQGRYDACLKRLDREPLAQVADVDLSEQLQRLRKRAEYGRAWDVLDQTGATADRETLKKMEAFFRKYPDPPSAAERDRHAQLERRLDRLKSEISVHVLDQARDLDTLLSEAAQIIGNGQIEESIKQQARHQVTEWLQHRLPKIEAPQSLLGKQEAVTKSGQRKIGIFFLPPGVDNFRFWTDRKNRDKLRQGEEQIASSTLDQPPAAPRYVMWAERYNQQAADLLRGGTTRADWQQFADDCDAWQQQLAAYREQWGIEDEPDRSCREWSFRDAGLIARNVLRHWNQYEQIVAPTP